MQPNLELVKANVEGEGVCGLSLPKRPSSSQVLWRNLWKKSITSEINTLILPFGRDKHYQERGIKNLWTCSRSEECVPLWWRGSCWRASSIFDPRPKHLYIYSLTLSHVLPSLLDSLWWEEAFLSVLQTLVLEIRITLSDSEIQEKTSLMALTWTLCTSA